MPPIARDNWTTYVFGQFRLDPARRLLSAGQRTVELQTRAFDILVFLVSARDRVVSREEIFATVWRGQVVVPNNLTVQMSALRRALAEHGADGLIETVPGRGYRFAGEVSAQAAVMADAPVPAPRGAWSTPLGRLLLGGERTATMTAAGGIIGVAAVVILALAAGRGPKPARFTAHVQVEAQPDTVVMAPEGFCRVDYRFRLMNKGELQLDTEDVRFHLVSGEPVSPPSVRGRIYHGSFPIRGPGEGVYHNNLYLPTSVVTAAKALGKGDVYLRHLFHLSDPEGHEVSVPAVVQIIFGDPAEGCRHVQ